MDDNIIVFLIYNKQKRWYNADRELWFLDENKRMKLYERAGYKIDELWIDEKRRDIMLLDTNVAEIFLKRIEENQCKTRDLQHDILPSLYIDFDEKELYSMYSEPASYEDYVPIGWKSEFINFLNLIPSDKQYWKV